MRPRLLDLFCGAGGAAMGYSRAGFNVVGVDIVDQPHYPFTFIKADAMKAPVDLLSFDAVHASPPCQRYSTASNRWRGRDSAADTQPDLIGLTRFLLEASGLPWVMENVVGAARTMRPTLLLNGGMFGLGVHRPRLFESNVVILSPGPGSNGKGKRGVHGDKPDGRWMKHRVDGSPQLVVSSLAEAQEAMGMDWADWHGTKEAIPPAYTEHIGRQLLAYASTHEKTP